MFKEYTSIALTESVPLERLYDIPPDSPLLAEDNSGDGLRPGDVGIVVDINPDGDSFLAEFLEPSGYTVALVDLKVSQARPATEEDFANDRFGVTVLSQRPAAWQGDRGFAEYTNIILTEPMPRSELRFIPEDSPLRDRDRLEDGLNPGAVGFITSVDYAGTDREVLSVSFRDANGRFIARAEVRPSQCRPATPADRGKYSLAAKAAVGG